jgi:hypothetical protein
MPDEYKDGRDVLLLSYQCDDASIGSWDGRKWVGRCDGHNCVEYMSDLSGTEYREVEIPDHWCPLPPAIKPKSYHPIT